MNFVTNFIDPDSDKVRDKALDKETLMAEEPESAVCPQRPDLFLRTSNIERSTSNAEGGSWTLDVER